MSHMKQGPPIYATPVAAPGHNGEQYVQATPTWVVVVRAFQVIWSVILLGMCAYILHGAHANATAFTAAVCIFTWIVVAYILISEKVQGARKLYNIWAVISLDALMVVFWLSSLGAAAALRASFKYDADVEYCYSDGSAYDSMTCVVSRGLSKREKPLVAGKVGLAVLAAIAGVSVIPFLLFVATLIFHAHTFRLHEQARKAASPDAATVEMKTQEAQVPLTQGYPAPVQPQYTGYSDQVQPAAYAQYPQHTPSPAPVPTPSPAPAYGAPAQMPPQQQHGAYQLPASPQPQGQAGPYQLPTSPPQQQPYGYPPQGQGPYGQQPQY